MKNLITICLLLTTVLTTQAQEKQNEVCDCPEPTKKQFQSVCQNIWDKEPYDGSGPIGYAFQEDLWKMSCADIEKDSKEIAWKKIECMWNKYREKFRCYFHSDSVANEKNILKFSIDSGFTVLISEFVKHNFDVNFKDPADNKTVLDFLKDQINIISNSPPVNEAKIIEYRRLYNKLLTIGAKHAKDL